MDDEIKFSISAEDDQVLIDYNFARVAPGLFELSFFTEKSSSFTYSVKYDGQEIRNSPFSLSVVPRGLHASTSRVSEMEKLFKTDISNEFILLLRDEYENPVVATDKMLKENINVTSYAVTKMDPFEFLFGPWAFKDYTQKMQACENNINLYMWFNPNLAYKLVQNNLELRQLSYRKNTAIMYNVTTMVIDKNITELHATNNDLKEEICRDFVNLDFKVSVIENELERQADGSIRVIFGKDVVEDANIKYMTLNVLISPPDGEFGYATTTLENDDVTLLNYAWQPDKYCEEDGYTIRERIVYMCLTSFVLAYNFIIIFLVWYWKEQNAIKFSQRSMLNLFLFGTTLATFGFWMMGFKPIYEWEHGCAFQIYFVATGSGISMLVMFTKLYRVHRLVAYAKATKKVKITDSWLFKRIGVVYCALTAYFLVAAFICPIKSGLVISPEPTSINDFGTKIYTTVRVCDMESSNIRVWYPFIVVGLFFTLTLLFMASLNRKVPTAFAESKWVAWSMFFIILMVMLSGALLYDPMIKFIDPAFYKGAQTYPTLASLLLVVSFIFIPKFSYIRRQKNIELTDLTKSIKKGHEQQTELTPTLRSDSASTAASTTAPPLARRSTAASQKTTFSRTGRMSKATFKPKFVKKAGSEDSSSSGLSTSPSSPNIIGETQSGGLASFEGSMNTFQTLNPLNEESEDANSCETKKTKTKKVVRLPSRSSDEGSKRLKEVLEENANLKKKNAKLKEEVKTYQVKFKAVQSFKRDRVPSDSPWQLFQDHNGRNYYYHTNTKACTYDKPRSWYE